VDNPPKKGNNLKAVDKLYSKRAYNLAHIDLDYGGIAFWEFPERKKDFPERKKFLMGRF